MAVYQFSALSDGQAISFNPNADVLNFDQTAISAADVRATAEGTSVRVSATGKEVFLLSSQLAQLTTGNVTFANGSFLILGDNTTAQTAANSGNSLIGGGGNDHLWGFGGNDTLTGNAGNDWLAGGTGQDNINGGAGADSMVFRETASNTNFDRVSGFVSGADKLMFHSDVFSGVNASGAFRAGAGVTSGQDADDRIIYNTSTGYVYYDADGSGAGRSQLVAILQGAPMLAAGDIGTFDDETTGGGGSGATEGNDTLVGTPGNDTMDGLGGDDSMSGLAGDDWLLGNLGNDVIEGGPGVDTVIGTEGDDSLYGGDGDDFVNGDGGSSGSPNQGHDFLDGGAGNDQLFGGTGNDTLHAAAGSDNLDGFSGNDLIVLDGTRGSYGSHYVQGGEGADAIHILASAAITVLLHDGERLEGGAVNSGATIFSIESFVVEPSSGAFDDRITGNGAANWLGGGGGNDTLNGTGDSDSLLGGAGQDVFVLDQSPGEQHADLLIDFESGIDKLHLNARAMQNIGRTGNFDAGDARFVAGPGLDSGQDSTDRIVYNTTTGELWYDADGDGTGAAQRIATLMEAPPLTASDLVVLNGGPAPIVGTSGDDTIAGSDGNDTIDAGGGNDVVSGFGGNDSIDGNTGNDYLSGGGDDDLLRGSDGNDTLDGGAGNDSLTGGNGSDLLGGADGDDTLDGGTGVDSLQGGQGNDTYIVLGDGDLTFDSGGLDLVIAVATEWTLAAGSGIENLELQPETVRDELGFEVLTSTSGTGNELDNVIYGAEPWWFFNTLDGGDGNDTLIGGQTGDAFIFRAGSGDYGHDHVDGGPVSAEAGFNSILFTTSDGSYARSAVVIDFREGTVEGGGVGGSGRVTFTNIGLAVGGAFDDVLIANDGMDHNSPGGGFFGGPLLYGADGNDTLTGGDSEDRLNGGAGNDELRGGVNGDFLEGGAGADRYVFDVAPGEANADYIFGFEAGADKVVLDAAVHPDLGPTGNFAAADARFFAGAGATSGQDASDRVIYDTTTGSLWYDADGNGGGESQLIVRLDGAPTITASNIAAAGGSGPGTTTGTAGPDTLVGDDGDDTIDGLAGNDSIYGHGGDDSLVGGDGNDYLDSGTGQDTLLGGAGNDSLIGADEFELENSASKRLVGGDGDDTLVGIPGETLDGGLGNDTYLVLRGGKPILVDAGGIDHVTLGGPSQDWTLGAGFEHLTSFTDGSGGGITLIGNELDNRIDARADYRAHIEGRAGNDTLLGDADDSFLAGDEGDDSLAGGAGGDFMMGGDGVDHVSGGDGNDSLAGHSEYPFEGHAHADTVDGGLGDDVYYVRGGNEVLLDAGGLDTVATAVDWTLGAGFENVRLEEAGITVRGNSLDNQFSNFPYWFDDELPPPLSTIHAGAGNDTLSGWGANFHGEDGDDLISVSADASVTGGAGADVFLYTGLSGGEVGDFATGVDSIRLDATAMSQLGASGRFAGGDARFHAAAGATGGHDADDRVVYNSSTGELFYDADGSGSDAARLITTLQPGAALAATDIEVINGTSPGMMLDGTAGSDSLAGGAGNDTLRGLAGRDTLSGNAGDDWLEGGSGQDSLTGGSGEDSFAFRESPTNSNFDRLLDFASGTDTLRFDDAVYTRLGAPGDFSAGDDRFFAGAGAKSGVDAEDRLVYDTSSGFLWYDADGSGAGGQQLVGVVQGAPALAASDIAII